jgi:hypothetical protein
MFVSFVQSKGDTKENCGNNKRTDQDHLPAMLFFSLSAKQLKFLQSSHFYLGSITVIG